MRKLVIIFSFVLLNNCIVKAQENRVYTGKKFAQKELDLALAIEKENPNYVGVKPLIKNEEMAIQVIEPIVVGKYGKERIELQKPYEVHKIEQYYIISGTLPFGSIGGTFVIIIDETNARVLHLTHYK
ncbi:YbbC/YhhH family protein [Flavobacterium sp. CBA20B-1]|uniref:YbbC/YhhH family protein n=1 Tax=unclassified Flavobacterium TaxID=196869 RepID=UPI0022259481|nr:MULTISPECIES: YbbC/YhhH family protein [unclassified Flavobacterium]WCM41217.1 YbbC/YhhH family protein [Flavobacterium sp. CBA20B-1]